MRLSPIAYGTFVIPCGVMAFCMALGSVRGSDLPACFPLVDGCISIREVLLEGPNLILFRLFVFPASLMMAWYWAVAAPWATEWLWKPNVLLKVAGWIGALGLAVLVGTLDVSSPTGEQLRLWGAVAYFLGAGSAGCALTVRLWPLTRRDAVSFPKAVLLGMALDAILVIGTGGAYLLLLQTGACAMTLNSLQWNLAFFIQIHFGLVSILWKRQQISTQKG